MARDAQTKPGIPIIEITTSFDRGKRLARDSVNYVRRRVNPSALHSSLPTP
jgi:hypothetical protein